MERPKTQFTENELEVFKGTLESRMKNLVAWINNRVQRVPWSNAEIEDKFTKRSAQQILTDGNTGFMNPCSDLTLVAWALLKKNGLHPSLIAEKLKWKRNGLVSMHFALEFLEEGELHALGFVSKNQAVLEKGEYTNRDERVETIEREKIESDIRFDQTMEEVLSDANFDGSGVNVERLVEHLQNDNTTENYEKYKGSLSHGGDLYLDLIL